MYLTIDDVVHNLVKVYKRVGESYRTSHSSEMKYDFDEIVR